jgi:hypothetical protein
VAYCIFAIALCGMYGKIYNDAKAQVKKTRALTATLGHDLGNIKHHGNKKAMIMVLAILLAFLVSNFLYEVVAVLKLSGVDPLGINPTVILLEAISFVFIQANSAVNVAVYAIFSQRFRRGYTIILCFCRHEQHSRYDDKGSVCQYPMPVYIKGAVKNNSKNRLYNIS